MPQPSRSYRPQVEQLEDRRLPAASIVANLSQGLLTIEGTNGADTIVVRQVAGALFIYGVNINVAGSPQATVAATAVKQIRVNGLAGNDVIWLRSEAMPGSQPITAPVQAWGGDGDDLIQTGYGDDTIYGGAGADRLYGDPGKDRIYAEAGDDEVYLEDGDDFADGGTGNDSISGGTGNDTIYGGSGNDYLDGGAGLDQLEGGTGFDRFREDFNLAVPILNGARPEDVCQPEAPLCAQLAALASLAYQGWDFSSQISYAGNGQYAVQISRNGQWHVENVAFDGSWNDNDAAPARDAANRNLPEFWVVLLNRARLQMYGVDYRRELTAAQWSAANVATGTMLQDSGEALYNFSGRKASFTYAYQTAPQTLFNALQARKAVVLNTLTNATEEGGIVAWHSYALIGMAQQGGTWTLRLYNPWAKDGRGAPRDGVDDGYLTITWDQFQAQFRSVRIA